ncbi:signal peptidase I [Paenibacillus psychroresistens]|uniref:Signal peptidase I n=1 Tax=Paenibacillus psychroresistens TaxID=1778678 RepID=A0A6B8RJX2_9BACL|nr:signal peptidase I [Paenibacillus psychroresistens]QGQ95892.1 signal peptidase I [Paenibacillus psychroresistens]
MIKRNPFLAALFSLVTPGTGQIYNGQLKKGIVFLFFPMIIVIIFSVSNLLTSFQGFINMIGVILLFNLYILIDTITISIKRKSIQRTALNKWYIYLLIILVMPLVFFMSERNIAGLRTFITDGPSMQPTLIANTRFMITTNTNNLMHGNIIIFNAPEGKMYVKRIIGIGGDTVEVKNNSLYLNGNEINEPYLNEKDNMDFAQYTVPEGAYFVMGDNRAQSHDSRAMGPITKDNIIGKALFVIYDNGKIVFNKKL